MNWGRWWPLTGIVFAALYLVGFAVSSSADTHDTNAQILAHYAKHSNRVREIAAFFIILAALLFLIWFLALLRRQLATLEGGQSLLAAMAFGSGLVAAALWVVGVAFFSAPAWAIADTHEFHLDPQTFRIFEDTGYPIWFAGTTIAALLVFAVAVLSLRTGFLPKWLAWLSFLVGVTMLVAFFFVPFLIMLGWFAVASITLIARPRPAAAAQPPPA